jgi:hypothetical protein
MPHNLPLCPLTVDDSFSPWAGDCRGGFDFTLLFEESILAIPLLCIFILVLPFRMVQLVPLGGKVHRGRFFVVVNVDIYPGDGTKIGA